MVEPTDSPLTRVVIPPTIVTGVVEVGKREGRPITSWFTGTGLNPDELVSSNTVRMSYRQAATILRRAIRAMPGWPLGMQVGTRDSLLSFGMVGMAMRACATGAEALQVALELHRASGSLVDAAAEVTNGQVTVSLFELAPDPELTPFLIEEALCSTVVFMRSMLGRDQSPTVIELSYSPPAYVREYAYFFRCPVRFDAPANRLRFPAEFLERRFATHDGLVRAAAIDTCWRLLDASDTEPSITSSVTALLDRDLRNPPTMAQVAEQLHMTERTLRRQLHATGESFSVVRDRVRERRATFLLHESTLTIEGIAREVGFCDAREFRRAYLRWTGRLPSATRHDAPSIPTIGTSRPAGAQLSTASV
ncbi:AraC family transcriptional regulator [Nocardia sp. CA-120079]|uniref:AraC family transcriptional regulator n=1 Tax=Nocardia sp. CA-120079 TaxID=3239974 RepID=UPI003D97358F